MIVLQQSEAINFFYFTGKEYTDDTHISYNGETLLSLKAALNSVEKQDCIEDIKIDLYMLVHYSDEGQYSTHSLVVTNAYFYILKEDYILWPQATFSQATVCRPKFEVLVVIPAVCRIQALQLYDTDTLSQRQSLAENINVTGMAATVTQKDFVGFGVRIAFVASLNEE